MTNRNRRVWGVALGLALAAACSSNKSETDLAGVLPDLSGADLLGADLVGVDQNLATPDLAGADLTGVDLTSVLPDLGPLPGEPAFTGTDDPDAKLAYKLTVTREVVRIPASDAPASDSETKLQATATATGATALETYYWQVRSAETGAEVFHSTDASPTFACPADGRGTYDVILRATAGTAKLHLAERRLVTCTLPRTAAGRTVHTMNLSSGSTFYQLGKVGANVVAPGDVIRVSGAATSDWQLVGFVGTAAKPIHVINDGLVTNTNATKLLQIVNCQHILIDGFGSDDHAYGFLFSNDGKTASGEQAIFVRNYTLGGNTDRATTDIELFGLHVNGNPNTGLEVLTGPGSAAFNRTNFALEHLLIHHNRMENVGDEGFYIGYNNDRTDMTSGFAPFQIHGAKIYRNVIRNTQWDGLQVANCSEGLEVHDNHVTETARERYPSQQSSFQYNSGSSGFVYRNFFADAGSDMQIGCTGGDLWVFDNVYDLGDAPAGADAIYLHGAFQPGVDVRIFGNTFRTRASNGVAANFTAPECTGTAAAFGSLRVVNNLFVFPTGMVNGVAPSAYRKVVGTAPTTLVSTPNLTRTEAELAPLCWADAPNEDYAITCATSPALDGSGASLATVDIAGTTLPLGFYTDFVGRAYNDPRNFGAYQSRSAE